MSISFLVVTVLWVSWINVLNFTWLKFKWWRQTFFNLNYTNTHIHTHFITFSFIQSTYSKLVIESRRMISLRKNDFRQNRGMYAFKHKLRKPAASFSDTHKHTRSVSTAAPPLLLFPFHLSICLSITHPLIEVSSFATGTNKELLVWGQILLTYKGNPSSCRPFIM